MFHRTHLVMHFCPNILFRLPMLEGSLEIRQSKKFPGRRNYQCSVIPKHQPNYMKETRWNTDLKIVKNCVSALATGPAGSTMMPTLEATQNNEDFIFFNLGI